MNGIRNHRTLSQLNQYLRKLIDDHIGGKRFWLKAEISQIKDNRSGHVYLDLIEQSDGKIIAKSKANIWSTDLIRIKNSLGQEYANIMKQGSEIMCLVEARFSEIYGFSIQVFDVDLAFNLGELERRKQETIRRLTEEGLMQKNGQLELPEVIQKVAIISAEGSDGKKDLTEQLGKNQYGYVFEYRLYSAAVQGEKAAPQIIERLKEVQNSQWDAVLIVRGGGSKIDLDAFNDYTLCAAIARCTIPVLTGIGHENDLSVADMVANTRLKTPSALGSWLVERAHNMDVRLQRAYERIRHLYSNKLGMAQNQIQLEIKSLRNIAINYSQLQRGRLHTGAGRIVRLALENLATRTRKLSVDRDKLSRRPNDLIKDRKGRLKSHSDLLLYGTGTMVREFNRNIDMWGKRLQTAGRGTLRSRNADLEHRKHQLENLRPDRILQRGFSITRKSDVAINYQTPLKDGDLLEIEIYKKKIFVQFLNDEPIIWNELKKELNTKKPRKNLSKS